MTGAEFEMFMNFLKSLSLFGEKAPPERVQELIEIIEGQADLDIQFNVCITCVSLSLSSQFFVILLLGADFNHELVNTAMEWEIYQISILLNNSIVSSTRIGTLPV